MEQNSVNIMHQFDTDKQLTALTLKLDYRQDIEILVDYIINNSMLISRASPY